MAILKSAEVTRRTGYPPSSIYCRASQGTFTKPIKIGVRASGWPDFEVESICAARIAGKSDDEVRALVAKLHAARTPDAHVPAPVHELREIAMAMGNAGAIELAQQPRAA